MDYFNKNKILIWIIIILLAINVSTVATIAYHFYNHDNNGIERMLHKRRQIRIPNKRFGRFMHRELNLSKSQNEKIQKFRGNFQHNAMRITKEMQEKRNEIFEELSKNVPDTMKLYRNAEDIGNLHKQLKYQTIKHYLNMKSVCNKQQQQTLLKMYKAMQNSKVDIVCKMRR